MKILAFGDVVGRSARERLIKELPAIRKEWKADAVLVNTDNASGGFGVLPKHADELIKSGADVLTGGDHIWDQKEIIPYLAQQPRLLRPLNYPENTPGRGEYLLTLADGRKLLVVHLLGQVFLNDYLDSPFNAVDKLLSRYVLGKTVQAILVDIHAEATSEKMAMGQFLDGRVTMVVGSHTHVPTADVRILKGGTAYQTDMGMCGDYDSVIGFEASTPLSIFISKRRKQRMTPADGPATLRGIYVESNDATGHATRVDMVAI